MNAEPDRRLVQLLERIVRESRELQASGGLRDPMSRLEITWLGRELLALESRFAAAGALGGESTNG